MSLVKKAGAGFFQFLFRNLLGRIMGFGAMNILARELTPYDFGLVSITEVLLSLIAVFATPGISEFLLAYRKDDVKEIFQAAFWFSLLLSILVGIIAFIFLPFWADSNDDPRIFNLGIIIIFIFILNTIKSIAKTYLGKNLDFAKQVKVQTPFIILVPLAKIAAVLCGMGVYSLVIPILVFAPIEIIFLYKAAKFYPKLGLKIHRWKEIFSFSKHVIGSTALSAITGHGDKLILGQFLGLKALGIYNLAYQFSNLITENVVAVTNHILSAYLPKIAHDHDLLFRKYMLFLKMMAFFIFPTICLMGINADAIINIIYGAKWSDAVLPYSILLIYALFRSISSSNGAVLNTLHLPDKALIIKLVDTPIHIIGSFIGASYSVVGLAITIVNVKIIFIQWGIHQVMTALGKKVKDYYLELKSFFFVTIFLYAISFFLFKFLQLGHWEGLIASSFFYLICYILIYRFVFTLELVQILTTLNTISSKFNIISKLLKIRL